MNIEHKEIAELGLYYPGEIVVKKDGEKVRRIFGLDDTSYKVVGIVTKKQEIVSEVTQKWFQFWKKQSTQLIYYSGEFKLSGRKKWYKFWK